MAASMNVTKEKLQRKKNFSADEVRVLTEGFTKYKIYLQAPFNNKVTNDGKNQRWNEIRDTVNALGHEVRSSSGNYVVHYNIIHHNIIHLYLLTTTCYVYIFKLFVTEMGFKSDLRI